MSKLAAGAFVLEASSDVEQVAAEAAVQDFINELVSEGEAPPRVSIIRAKAAFK
jgi:hypothetical protein